VIAPGKDRRDEETRAEHELAGDGVGGVVGGELEEEGSDDRRATVVGVEEEGVEVGREDEDGRVLVDCLVIVLVAHEGVEEAQLHPSFRWH